MDNKLRIKRVKEGIELLEQKETIGIFWGEPWVCKDEREYLGLSKKGWELLVCNLMGDEEEYVCECTKQGFIYSEWPKKEEIIYNWKRFLELIEKL